MKKLDIEDRVRCSVVHSVVVVGVGGGLLYFFLNVLIYFIHRTQDSPSGRDPTTCIQSWGGDQTKWFVDPGPRTSQNELTHGHNDYKNGGHEQHF